MLLVTATIDFWHPTGPTRIGISRTGALEVHQQALAGHRRVLGEDHPKTLNSMNNLAATRRALGDLQGAHDLHEQTLAARRRVLDDDHPDTLMSMNNLAAVRRELGS